MFYAFPLPLSAAQLRIVAKVDKAMVLFDCLSASLQTGQATQLNLDDSLVEQVVN
jgi:hypothetical protein